MDWYACTREEVLTSVGSSLEGLSSGEVARRVVQFGRNELQRKSESKVLKILIGQLKSSVVYILVAALVIALFLDELIDAVVIAGMLVLNTLLGFIQEFKADSALEKLKQLATPRCLVIRDGQQQYGDARLLVPGDIIVLEEGAKVPADAYLLEVVGLKVDESLLTGESASVKKSVKVLSAPLQVSSRENMVFSSTIVTAGRALAVVVATGMGTEVGAIAHLLQESEEKQTPLQKKLDKLGGFLALMTVILTVIVFFSGVLRGEPLLYMLLVAVGLAVAAIPEGLPAVVTIALSMGVRRMIRRNVLVRKLASVETLGSTTIICTDKTGTLTCNQMMVARIFAQQQWFTVTGDGYKPFGFFLQDGKPVDAKILHPLIRAAKWCSNAEVHDMQVIGDPTEAALVVLAQKAQMISVARRLDEVPFTSEDKCMFTLHEFGKEHLWQMKGAPEVVLEHCVWMQVGNRKVKLNAVVKKQILAANATMAHDALRVLAVAEGKDKDGLIFLGLVGMLDPPRPSVPEAIAKCKVAGIRIVMITGDHQLTAQAIARQIGLDARCLTGSELDVLSDEKLREVAKHIDIYARVSPLHKVRILEALRSGQVVAMTGDGINDAPALKRADIGVAVGSATDVAKESADMILLDDNFSSLVSAVEEGRGIYDNIKKFINFLLSSNLGEVLILFFAMLIGFYDAAGNAVVPLLAVHLLWINLVTDGLPALALGADPIDPKVMSRKPRDPREPLMTKNMVMNILITGLVMTIGALLALGYYHGSVLAQTMVFTFVVVFEMARLFVVRSLYKLPVFSNPGLLLAVGFSLLLQVLVVHVPFLQRVLKTVSLGVVEWLQVLLLVVMMAGVGLVVHVLVRKITKQFD